LPTLYGKWSDIPANEKERMVEEFLVVIKEKLLSPETKEINISNTKGIQRMYFGKLMADQKWDGRETYTIKLNHSGDL
jgi:hypothetical protein